MRTGTLRTIILGIAAACILNSCAAQIAVNIALKRDAGKDGKRYAEKIEKYSARYPEWMANMRDTSMLSPNNGAKLHAIYMPAPAPTLKTAFILHGHTDSAAGMLRLARWYNETLGYNVFLPDFYAHGLSEGKYRQMGWLDRHDFIEWIKMANNIFRTDANNTEMVVTGVSMGGAATMMVSPEVQKNGLDFVKCFVEDCGYTSFYAEAEYIAPTLPMVPKKEEKRKALLEKIDKTCKKKYGWSFSEASAVSQVADCHLPMLFIHGGADNYVPTYMVYEVYEAKTNGDKELLIVPETGHGKASRTKLYREAVQNFLQKYIQ